MSGHPINPCDECAGLKVAISDLQAREAMLREALKAAQQFIGPKGSVAGEDHWALVTIIEDALSPDATSWLKREKAKVWREAGRVALKTGAFYSIVPALLDRAAALEAEAGKAEPDDSKEKP